AAVHCFRFCFRRNTCRMPVKTFRCPGEHPPAGPLFRPKADLFENALVLSNKFAKTAPVQLRKNLSSKNLHARDPSSLHIGLAPINYRQFASFHSRTAEPLGERVGFIITNAEFVSSRRVNTLPEVLFVFGHLKELSCRAQSRHPIVAR